MKGKNLAEAFSLLAEGAKRHSPEEICIGFGIAAGAGAVVTAITGTIKAKKLIEAKKKELSVEKLTVKDTIKTVWKCYIPTAALGVASAAAIGGGTKISIDKTAAMGALYNAGREMVSDYKKSVEETVDEETKEEIEKKAAEKTAERIEKADPEIRTIVYNDGAGLVMFIDSLSQRRFFTTVNKVEAAVNTFNASLNDETSLTVNDWYYILCQECSVDLDDTVCGDMLGWDLNRTGLMRIRREPCSRDDRPCFLIVYKPEPIYLKRG